MPGVSDSPIPMTCEHGNDRAECPDCAAERTMREAKTRAALDELRVNYTVVLGSLGSVEPKSQPSNKLTIKQILADWEKASSTALPFPESEKDRLLLLVAQEVSRD